MTAKMSLQLSSEVAALGTNPPLSVQTGRELPWVANISLLGTASGQVLSQCMF